MVVDKELMTEPKVRNTGRSTNSCTCVNDYVLALINPIRQGSNLLLNIFGVIKLLKFMNNESSEYITDDNYRKIEIDTNFS